MTMTEIEVGLWKPEEDGDSIEGILLKVENNVGANNSNLYTIEVDNKPFGVWGSAILDPRMASARIGDFIKIEYKGLGEAKAGHSAPKIFKLYIDLDKRDEVAKPIKSEKVS